MTDESNLGFDDPFDGYDPTLSSTEIDFPLIDGEPFPEPDPLPWPDPIPDSEPDPTPEPGPDFITETDTTSEFSSNHGTNAPIAGGVGSNNCGWPCACTGLYL